MKPITHLVIMAAAAAVIVTCLILLLAGVTVRPAPAHQVNWSPGCYEQDIAPIAPVPSCYEVSP
jgi:hypothetical protein